MAEWKTFEQALAQIEGVENLGLNATLGVLGAKPVPPPSWDSRPHRVAMAGGKPQIQIRTEQGWVVARLTPPEDAKAEAEQDVETKTRSILFMDVKGWSALGATEIEAYVTRAMPELAKITTRNDFINTWGDSIVATFESTKVAAEVALQIRDFFKRGTPREGIAAGLTCRISLHVAEAIIMKNALTGKRDIFGAGIHMAARLEPVTSPGHVFCTGDFARRLEEIAGTGPRAWALGQRTLPKEAGTIEVFVVTWANEEEPVFRTAKTTPALQHQTAEDRPSTVDPESLFVREALKIELRPPDGRLGTWQNDSLEAEAILRVTNTAPFPVRIRELLLEWAVIAKGTGADEQVGRGTSHPDVVFLELETGDKYDFPIRAEWGNIPRPFSALKFAVSGSIIASAAEWKSRGEIHFRDDVSGPVEVLK